jgi:hypothetical protein
MRAEFRRCWNLISKGVYRGQRSGAMRRKPPDPSRVATNNPWAKAVVCATSLTPDMRSVESQLQHAIKREETGRPPGLWM